MVCREYRVTRNSKVSAPAHAKHLGWHLEFWFRMTHGPSYRFLDRLVESPIIGQRAERSAPHVRVRKHDLHALRMT